MLLLINDAQTRHLPDGALVNRLASDVLAGLRSPARTALVGGCRLLIGRAAGISDPTNAIWALTHRKPGASTVTRNADGTTDVLLTAGIEVHVYPAGGVR